MSTSKPNPFAIADRVSDQIINIIDKERTLPDFDPVMTLYGQCLAFIGFIESAPKPLPPKVQAVLDSTVNLLQLAKQVRGM